MKTLIYIFLALAGGLMIFNLFHVDFDAPLSGASFPAAIGVGASLCALILLIIMLLALRVQQKIKDKS